MVYAAEAWDWAAWGGAVEGSGMTSRAAVVIGVNKTGGLQSLNAAVSGACKVADWLRGEGFDVTCLVDDPSPVVAADVRAAVDRYVELGTVEQLVIYFAGHGYLNGFSEVWLLSGAPRDPDAAINMTENAEYARNSGIPNVVFISDACRSVAEGTRATQIRGSTIFPNVSENGPHVEVDRFFATRPGDPALELRAEDATNAYVGLFTEMLRKVHDDPEPSLVRKVVAPGGDVLVVPCRRLKAVLPDMVDAAAYARSIRLTQRPELRLESGDEAYISRAFYNGPGPSFGKAGMEKSRAYAATADREAPADERLLAFGTQGIGSGFFGTLIHAAATDPAFREAQNLVIEADASVSATSGGIHVYGGEVSWALSVETGKRLLVLPAGNRRQQVVLEVANESGGRRTQSVLLGFAEGTGTVVARPPLHSSHVAVQGGRVANVSYVSEREQVVRPNQMKEQALIRSAMAAAARTGRLPEGREDAAQVADVVAGGRHMDTTSGLYAAAMFAELGLKGRIKEINEGMRRQTRVEMFDVALLAGALPRLGRSGFLGFMNRPVVPFCPMLTQSWSYLRPRGIGLAHVVERAAPHRLPALWTTFDAEGIALLRQAIERGELNDAHKSTVRPRSRPGGEGPAEA